MAANQNTYLVSQVRLCEQTEQAETAEQVRQSRLAESRLEYDNLVAQLVAIEAMLRYPFELEAARQRNAEYAARREAAEAARALGELAATVECL